MSISHSCRTFCFTFDHKAKGLLEILLDLKRELNGIIVDQTKTNLSGFGIIICSNRPYACSLCNAPSHHVLS